MWLKKQKKFLILLLLPLSLLLTACSVNVQTKNQGGVNDGGVFITNTKGDMWRQMSYIPTISGNPDNFNNADIERMYIDPSDSGAVYLSIANAGLYYTYNIGRGWNKVHSLPSVVINDLAIDHKNKCVLYAALENKLYKSEDCARSFSEVYYDNNLGVSVKAVAVDHYQPQNIYIGTSRGEVIRSLDGGFSWRTIQRLGTEIRKIVVNPQDSRSVFVITDRLSLYRFNPEGGANIEELEQYDNRFDNINWMDYSPNLKDFNLGSAYKDLLFSKEDNSLFLATDQVILRSFDEGKNWTRLPLLTPENDSFINAIAINPQNPKEIYYVTDTSYYRSNDGGENWNVRRLPTSRSGKALVIDFNNPEIMYLGIKKIKK